MRSSQGTKVPPLRIGPLEIWPPVVLSPMVGITDHAYRRICREMGAGLCTSQMVSARALVEAPRRAREIAAIGEHESPRSLQILGGDPRVMGEAVRRVRDSVDHIDLNFGCPDTRVMGQCAGASVPARPELFRAVIRAAVTAAGPIPVTVKFRLGLDAGTPTFRHAGRVAEEEGCAAVALHARTVEDAYRGEARWECIRELKDLVRIPVLGNGDVFRATDGLRMLRTTGCDAVLVGRGCLGNPWLFSDLRAVLGGEPEPPPPGILEMGRVIRTHYRYLRERFHPRIATLKIRKCGAWYACGFPDAAALREGFQALEEPEDLERLLERMEANLPGAPREGSASR